MSSFLSNHFVTDIVSKAKLELTLHVLFWYLVLLDYSG